MTRFRPNWFPERWTQLSLPRLLDDDDDVGARQAWAFAIVTIERTGRLTLPTVARVASDGREGLRLSARGEVALLGRSSGGCAVAVDGRGRIVVPCWLRTAAGPDGSLLVGSGTDIAGEPIVLLAPSRLLGGFAEAVVGEW